MKTNKGFAPLLILLVIAAVVGGGTYYAVSKNTAENSNDINEDMEVTTTTTHVEKTEETTPSQTISSETQVEFEKPKITIKPSNLGYKFPPGYPVRIEWNSDTSIKNVVVTIRTESGKVIKSETVANTGIYINSPIFTTTGKRIYTIADANNSTIKASQTIEIFSSCNAQYEGTLYHPSSCDY